MQRDPAPVSVETEIKLQLLQTLEDEALRGALRDALAIDLPRSSTRSLRSIYFDTGERELAARDLSLRLRQIGSNWVQTLKVPAKQKAGLQAYRELEVKVPDGKLDLAKIKWRPRDLAWLISRQEKLRPAFETDMQRSIWLLDFGEDKVELAWDRGHIRAKAQAEAVNELELELKAGSPDRLFGLAMALVEGLPLRFAHATKAARGVRLATGNTLVPLRAGAVRLKPDESAEAVFRRIAEESLRQMHGNESAIIAGGGAEAIHQFRVALRRLRAAAGTFRDLIEESVYDRWSRDLKWTHQAFGRARDLDVVAKETMAPLQRQYPSDPGLQMIARVTEEARLAARTLAQGAIDSRRYSLMQLDIARLLNNAGWIRASGSPTAATSVLEFARKQLQRRYKRVRKLGDQWPNLETPDLHRLRILVKKMRYAAQSFSSLFPGKAGRGFFAGLETLQDCLGSLNDGLVGQQYMSELAAMAAQSGGLKDGELERAVGIVSGWHARGVEEGRQGFEESWLGFRNQKRFWI
jgi:inorganic triphosphatase YgiF